VEMKCCKSLSFLFHKTSNVGSLASEKAPFMCRFTTRIVVDVGSF
jgi:hypothetical protein